VEDALEEVQWDGSRPAFVQMPEWLLFHPDLSDGATRTWQALASYADRRGEAFPGVKTLAKRRGKGVASMFNHLRELEEAGALRRTARYRESDGGRTSTLYVLAWAHPFVSVPDSLPPEPVKDDLAEASKNGPELPPSKKLEGGPPLKNWIGPPLKNWTPITRPSYELTPVVPTVDKSEADTAPPKGAPPPSGSPSGSNSHHRRSGRRGTPRQLGTNPRALAAQSRATAETEQRLTQARQYGKRMASIDPPPWTAEEFSIVVADEYNDEALARTALDAYVEVIGTS
jgi:Helix-turn-helix domain